MLTLYILIAVPAFAMHEPSFTQHKGRQLPDGASFTDAHRDSRQFGYFLRRK